MSDIRVLTYEEHGNKRWFKPTDFRFAAKDRVVAIGFSEIPKAMLSVPLGFVKNEESYQTVVVQGLDKNQNLLVTANGQWVADYIPVLYRTMPFRLARNPEGQFVLCIDHDSGLLTDTPAGHQFFGDEKKLAVEATATAALLTQFEADRPRMAKACKLLGELGVIEMWPLQLQYGDDIRNVDGLYRINETKLMELPAETLLDVRNSGGLLLCYAQLFSMQHMQQLGNVSHRAHWSVKAAEQASKVVPLNIVDDNGILSFANL